MSVTLSNPAAAPGALPIHQVFPSLTNPRQNFSGDSFNDLVESIRQHGVLQPVLVRSLLVTPEHVDRAEAISPLQFLDAGEDGFEIVCGERRFRAALQAGLQSIPAVVRELSDSEAREIQIVENLQRQDVSALEEAEGFRQLLESMQAELPEAGQKELVQTIAQKIGKSVRYVYARMQLTGLIAPVKQALAEGKIEASHADLLVRQSPEKQREIYFDQFVDYNSVPHDFDETKPDADLSSLQLRPPEELPSVRQLKRSLESNAQPLKKAAWKWKKDTAETPACAGSPACVGCEHNTASQEGADPKDARCLNEQCFAQKTKNFIDVRVVDLEAKTGKSMVKVSKSDYSAPKGAKKPSAWRSAKLGSCDGVTPAIEVGYDGAWEGVLTVCLNSRCKEHFANGSTSDGSTSGAETAQAKQHREETEKKQAECKRENTIRARLFQELLSRVTKLTPEILRQFVQSVISDWDAKDFAKVLPNAAAILKKGKTDSAEFAHLLLTNLAWENLEVNEWSGVESGRDEFHADLAKSGLDWQPLRAKFLAEYDKPKASPEKKSSPEAKKAAAKKQSKQPAKKVSAKKGGRK
jgi:ParB/RepB/Spo0J family partition protein